MCAPFVPLEPDLGSRPAEPESIIPKRLSRRDSGFTQENNPPASFIPPLTYPFPMNLALAGLSYGITVVALVLLVVRTKKLIGIYKKGQPDSTRGNDKAQRFKMAFGEIFGHTKMFNFSVVGLAHWFVMVGFFVLFGTLATAYGQIINPYFALPIIGHFWVYEYITELIAWATGISIVALIGIRQVTLRTNKRSRFAGSGNGKAYYVEATILLIVFCVIALRGLEGALSDETAWNRHFITTWFIAAMFKSMTLTQLENCLGSIKVE